MACSVSSVATVSLTLALLLDGRTCHAQAPTASSPAGTAGRTPNGPPVGSDREGGLSVLAIGDWGGTGFEPYYTDVEERNAFAMAGVAESVLGETGSPVRLVAAMGDNFYLQGIDSADSDRWKSTYEDVFSQDVFADTPFFAILGNHDYYGTATAQYDYALPDPNTGERRGSGRWKFPANGRDDLYYSITESFAGEGGQRTTVEFFMLDTVAWAGLSCAKIRPNPSGPGWLLYILAVVLCTLGPCRCCLPRNMRTVLTEMTKTRQNLRPRVLACVIGTLLLLLGLSQTGISMTEDTRKVDDPTYGCPETDPSISATWRRGVDSERQRLWLESALRNSTADWRIVTGHYPIYSIAEHGPNYQLIDELKPLLERYNVAMYLCGHDHNAQHLSDGSGPEYIVAGAGSPVDPSQAHKDASFGNGPSGEASRFYLETAELGSFAHMRFLSRTQMELEIISSDGVVQYALRKDNPNPDTWKATTDDSSTVPPPCSQNACPLPHSELRTYPTAYDTYGRKQGGSMSYASSDAAGSVMLPVVILCCVGAGVVVMVKKLCMKRRSAEAQEKLSTMPSGSDPGSSI